MGLGAYKVKPIMDFGLLVLTETYIIILLWSQKIYNVQPFFD